jgi:hypothetical protein
MSVTFTISKNFLIDVPNKHFNPMEEEDPFYNPRTMKEFVYPALNVSNANSVILFEELNLGAYNLINTPYHGVIEGEAVETFVLELEKYKRAYSTRKSLKFEDDSDVYVIQRIPMLDKIGRFAMAFSDKIHWA